MIFNNKKKKTVVHFPIELENKKYQGGIYGYYHEDSNNYNIVEYGEKSSLKKIGIVFNKKEEIVDDVSGLIIGYYENNSLMFFKDDLNCEKKPYELEVNIFSRNSGILETGKMLNKSAIISGCGSVGSLVALELARSGVGSFLLVDNDIFEYHNICRHQCGVKDVGKNKVDALEERILDINPNAKVVKQNTILERVPEKVFNEFIVKPDEVILIGCGDNRESDLYANKISYIFNIPFLSIGFWERAFAGEVFYSIPHETACYHCQFNSMVGTELDFRVNKNHRFYIDEKEVYETTFEPGISVDINFVTAIGIKLIIDIINRHDEEYIPKVMNDLSQYTFIANTNNPKIGGEMAEIFAYPLQVTTSIVVDKDEKCSICVKKGNTNG